MLFIVLIFFGLALGSFVNALVWRLHEQEQAKREKQKAKRNKRQYLKKLSILKGRSMCPNCHHRLAAKDLVPVLSWLVLGGKCRYCHKPISIQYPLIEMAAAGLFVFSYYFWPLNFNGIGLFEFIVWLALLTGFIALAVYDIRWFLLPNKIIYPLLTAALVQLAVVSIWNKDASSLLGALWGALILGGGFYAMFLASKGKWIGGGDVRLGFLLGIIVGGPLMSLLLLLIASLSGSAVSLPLLVRGKVKAQSKIPFGPFLMVAAVVVELFGAHMIHWYKNQLI